jgi:hypothetical protein
MISPLAKLLVLSSTGQGFPVISDRFRVGGDNGVKPVMDVTGDFDEARCQPMYILLSFAN